MRFFEILGTLLALGFAVSASPRADSSKLGSSPTEDSTSYVQLEKEVKARFSSAVVEKANPNINVTAPASPACNHKQSQRAKLSKSGKLKRETQDEDEDEEDDCPWPDATWTPYKLYSDSGNRLGEAVTSSRVPPRTVQTVTGNLVHTLRTSSQIPDVRHKYSKAFVIIDPILRAEFQIEFQAWPKRYSGIGEGVRALLNDGYGGRYFESMVDYAVEDIVNGKANAVRWYMKTKNPKGNLGRITVSGFSERDIRNDKSHHMPFESVLYPDGDDGYPPVSQ